MLLAFLPWCIEEPFHVVVPGRAHLFSAEAQHFLVRLELSVVHACVLFVDPDCHSGRFCAAAEVLVTPKPIPVVELAHQVPLAQPLMLEILLKPVEICVERLWIHLLRSRPVII